MSTKGILLNPVMEECPYLQGRVSITENFLIKEIDDEDLEYLLSLGYRHFGEVFFRPVCGACKNCIPIRIPIREFSPSKSVRRLCNRNKRFQVTLEKPAPSRQTYDLYKRHKKRFAKKFYESYELYVRGFFASPPFKFDRALVIRDGSTLVAYTHLDVTANAMSAIYCYFDEKYKQYSPGKFSIYKEIEIAGEAGIKWLYLGFYVPGNRHMKYKIQYKPNQLMFSRHRWVDFMDASGAIVNPLPRQETDNYLISD